MRRGHRFGRRGAATVEMAIVTPILLAILFGIIEYGWVFMLQSSLTGAAREACRVGILPGATDTEIKTSFATAVAATGLSPASSSGGSDGYTVDITRVTNTSGLQTLTVTARVPWKKASLVGGGLLPDPRALLRIIGGSSTYSTRTSDMVASCSMMMERT